MMINELPQTYEGIAETFFENPDDRTQFRKVMLSNMKESTGIDPDITNETIADTMNEERDNDLYQGTEKGLMINPSDAETRKNMLSNMEIIGKLSRVYPDTAVEELFSDDYLSRNIATDDTFLINATNTNLDYPVYISRWNMFATRLLDRLNQDDPSLWSIAKRVGTPMLLGAIETVGKKAAGKTFLAHGLTAAYDVTQLGDSIYNTQKRFNARLDEVFHNKNLNAEQYVQEIDKILDDVQQVPEEYRYEVYKSLWEGPDIYADAGLSFSGFGVTGIMHGLSSLKSNIIQHLPSFSSQNVKSLVLNDQLGQKIIDLATNASNEEKAIEKVTAKVTANQPKDAPESEIAVAKGVAVNEDSDKNLRLNSNKDGGFFNWLRSLEIKPSKDLSDQRGEIRFEEPEQSYYIDHGKGINNEPLTSEEADKLIKKLQSNAVVEYDKNYTSKELPDYVAFSSASIKPWGPDDEGVIRPYLSEETARTGAGGMSFHYGIYASTVGGTELSRKHYLPYVHQTAAEENAFKSFMTDGVINKMTEETFKHTDTMDFEAVLRAQKDLKKVFSKPEEYDIPVYITQIKKKLKEAESNYDKTYYSEMITGLKEISKFDRKEITAYLNTFTGKNPIKYPYKYLFDDTATEPYVSIPRPEDFKEIPLENQNKYKEVNEKFNKWKQNIKEAVKEKYPEEFGSMNPSERLSRDDWEVILETYVKDVLNIKEDPEYWLRAELNKMGFSAWIHIHHDGAMNIVTINDKDFSEVTKLENNPKVVKKYLQVGGNNGVVKVSAGDGVGYYVRELHGVKGAKPMIIENEKVIDFGDYKEYNPKK